MIACPAASLRSVNIRRHRSPTRGIIAVFSSKAYWTFVVHALAKPLVGDFRRTKVDPVPRILFDPMFTDDALHSSRERTIMLGGRSLIDGEAAIPSVARSGHWEECYDYVTSGTYSARNFSPAVRGRCSNPIPLHG